MLIWHVQAISAEGGSILFSYKASAFSSFRAFCRFSKSSRSSPTNMDSRLAFSSKLYLQGTSGRPMDVCNSDTTLEKLTWCCKKLWWIWDYCNISPVRWQQWICSTLDSVFNIELWTWHGSLKLDFSGNQNMSISRVSNDRSQSWVSNAHVTPSIPSVHMARARFSSAE